MVSLGNWLEWVSTVAVELSGSEVLELGHGPGHLQTLLARNGIKTTGLDLSPQMGRIAARRLRRRKLEFRLIRGQAQRLPFENGTFQQVTATFPSEYIFDPQTLIETFRVLSPGGKFIILPVAFITGDHFLERLTAMLYKITGQSLPPDGRVLKRFEDSGFNLRTKWIRKPDWEVLILIAQKPSLPTN